MAHIEKYQASALGNMLGHYERRAELEHGYERENIDPSRTPENYNLCARPAPLGFVDERIAALDLKRAPRKDAVRMIDTVVTLPAAYHGDTREFMAAVKETLDGIFGAENCAGAYVHMDETTPHMHYASVPVTSDGRLSAKSLLNRTFMKRFHDRLEAGVCERLGIERAGLTLTDEEREQRASKYVDLPEYKAAQDAVRRKERRSMELNNEIADKEGDLIELDSAIEDRRFELQVLGEQIQQETRRLESVRRAIEEKQLEPAPQTVAESARTLWTARNDGAREEVLAGEIDGLRSRISELEGANQRARERVAELDRGLPGLRGRYQQLERRFSDVAGRVRQVIERLREVPETVSAWALDIAHKLGKRTYDPRSLDYMAREATRAAELSNRARGWQPRQRRDWGAR